MMPAPHVPQRYSVLGFLDSLYASIIAFSFALSLHGVVQVIGKATDQPLSALWTAVTTLGPTVLVVAFVTDDWLKARTILSMHGYDPQGWRPSLRMWLDVGIALVAFLLMLASPRLTYFKMYLGLFSVICAMGWLWAKLLLDETNQADDELEVIKSSHWTMALVMGILTVVFYVIDYWLKDQPATRESLRIALRWISAATVSGAFVTYKIALFMRRQLRQPARQGGIP